MAGHVRKRDETVDAGTESSVRRSIDGSKMMRRVTIMRLLSAAAAVWLRVRLKMFWHVIDRLSRFRM